MRIDARAKINWALAVTGVRPDGYHLLDTLMQTVALHDTLYIEPDEALTLSVEGGGAVPVGEENLVLRAARALAAHGGEARGARLRLVKRIPSGAGLGGGSADAAAALRGLCALWDVSCTAAELSAIATQLGADVPFCLAGGLARARGIGEVLEPLPPPTPIDLVIVHPGISLATPAVFRRYDERPAPDSPSIGAVARAVCARDLPGIAASTGNDLQPAAASLCPAVDRGIEALLAQGAVCAGMTGSGSAVFGVFASAGAAERAARATGGIATRTLAAGEG